MQDSNSVNGNPFTETGIQWLRFFFFFFFNFFLVGKVLRYNTVLASFRDNPALERPLLYVVIYRIYSNRSLPPINAGLLLKPGLSPQEPEINACLF